MQEQREWLTLDEAASVLKIGIPTVQSLINRGILHARQDSEPTTVSYQAILAFLRQDQRVLLEKGQQHPDFGLTSDDQPT